MQTIIGFFSGSSMGFFTGSFFGGSETGQSGLIESLILNFGNWQLHLHHWLISLIILISLFAFLRKKYNFSILFLSFSFGFLSGLMFQGIYCYSDWYKILIK